VFDGKGRPAASGKVITATITLLLMRDDGVIESSEFLEGATMSYISLKNLGEQLRTAAEESDTGLGGQLVKDNGRFQQMFLRINKGGSLPEHSNPGEATLLVLDGAVRFIENESKIVNELRPGDLIEVPDCLHSVEADEESLLLLSFAVL
jgi:quercetin dioxygenase-like cupin family protein